MSEKLVCDATALVALLLDGGHDGQWVAEAIKGSELAAPELALYETANVIRRHEMSEAVSPDQAALAHADLLDLSIETWPFEILAARAWELRRNLTSYDASYVALAELLGAPLITLDRGIEPATGVRCAVLTPPQTQRDW